MNQMEEVTLRHVKDEEHFLKIQLADQNNLEERLDSLQVSSKSPHQIRLR